jgi:60 kDa SS-A/Ro ribonucleoprotein
MYAKHLLSTQQKPIPGREAEMVPNGAGGFNFALPVWDAFERFLILGSEGGTYYVSERKLTRDAAKAALTCLAQDPLVYLELVSDVHGNGRAPKWQPAVFALALASVHGDERAKAAVKRLAPGLLRTGAQLLYFTASCNALGKWRRNLRGTIQAWFDARDANAIAYQALKYQSRDGFAMRDILRLAHPVTEDPHKKAVFDRICGRDFSTTQPMLLEAETLMRDTVKAYGPETAIGFASMLPREILPSEINAMPAYWQNVVRTLPPTALIRNLATMTRLGLMENEEFLVPLVDRLTDVDTLRRARVHPMSLLLAFLAYSKGGAGLRSSAGPHVPHPAILGALGVSFETSLTRMIPIEGPILVACDVSGSMDAEVNGSPGMKAREAAAAIALMLSKACREAEVVPFNTNCPATQDALVATSFGRSSRVVRPSYGPLKPASLLELILQLSSMSGGTDCAAPIRYATQNRRAVRAIIIVSDQDSWAGQEHVAQAMEEYRQQVVPDAKLVVMATTGQGSTLVDPQDRRAIGIAGFDLSAFQVVEWFLRS